MTLPTTKPYLVRAIYEWCCDNGFTPYIAVKVGPRTRVPIEFAKDGKIILNISAAATNRLVIGNELIEFQARFGGVARELSVPLSSVLAIYARENGGGMAFEVEEEAEESVGTDTVALPEATPPETEPPPTRPRLQRVK